MQKLKLPLALALLLISGFFGQKAWASTAPGGNSNPFLEDLSQIDCQMSELDLLEQWVTEHNSTYTEMLEAGNPLIHNVLPTQDIASSLFGSSAPGHERLLDIPGFLWGFCCSFVGVFLMYLSIDDPIAKKKEGTQAIIGCGVGTLLWVGLYVWLVLTASYY